MGIGWTRLGTLQFTRSDGAARSDSQPLKASGQFIAVGPLSWQVTSHGSQVVDQHKDSRADTTLLTDRMVRPHDMVYSGTLGSIFFYGDALYRYHLASHAIERASSSTFGVIRKLIPAPSGVWIVAERGIYLLEKHGGQLSKIVHPVIADDVFLNGVATDDGIWVATNNAQLLRIILHNHADIELLKSNRLVIGRPAEMIYKNAALWLLASNNHGDSYTLAFVEATTNQLNMVMGKYFSLQQKDNLLWAANHSTMLAIDPVKNFSAQVHTIDPGLLSRSAQKKSVLFAGYSYGYKDSCEIVERGRLDLSKGWLSPLTMHSDRF